MSFKKTNEAVKRNSGKVGNIRYFLNLRDVVKCCHLCHR